MVKIDYEFGFGVGLRFGYGWAAHRAGIGRQDAQRCGWWTHRFSGEPVIIHHKRSA